MDSVVDLVKGIFSESECFPYARFYLQWQTNKVRYQMEKHYFDHVSKFLMVYTWDLNTSKMLNLEGDC